MLPTSWSFSWLGLRSTHVSLGVWFAHYSGFPKPVSTMCTERKHNILSLPQSKNRPEYRRQVGVSTKCNQRPTELVHVQCYPTFLGSN